MDSIEQLLKELTEAHGVPGYETPIRAVVRKYLEPLGPLSQDKIGSVICEKLGNAASPRVMLAGHMDEIGFMVRQITKEGFLKFLPLGGWFDQVLLGQRVLIKPNMCVAYHTYDYAATTNPWVVGELVRLCLGAGASRVRRGSRTIGRRPTRRRSSPTRSSAARSRCPE